MPATNAPKATLPKSRRFVSDIGVTIVDDPNDIRRYVAEVLAIAALEAGTLANFDLIEVSVDPSESGLNLVSH